MSSAVSGAGATQLPGPAWTPPLGSGEGPRPPSKSNRTAVIVTLAVVLLLAGGVTAVVLLTGTTSKPAARSSHPAPPTSAAVTAGFPSLSPTDSLTASVAPPPTASGSTYPATSTEAGDTYFRDVAAADLNGLKALACPTTTIKLTQAQLDAIGSAAPDGPAIEIGDSATQVGVLKGKDGSSAKVTVYLKLQSSGWCLDKTMAG